MFHLSKEHQHEHSGSSHGSHPIGNLQRPSHQCPPFCGPLLDPSTWPTPAEAYDPPNLSQWKRPIISPSSSNPSSSNPPSPTTTQSSCSNPTSPSPTATAPKSTTNVNPKYDVTPAEPFVPTNRKTARALYKQARLNVLHEVMIHAWQYAGRIYFLCKNFVGKGTAGYDHIMHEHGSMFIARGWVQRRMGYVMEQAMQTGTVIGYQNVERWGNGPCGRPIYRFIDGKDLHHIAITAATSGYIISANLYSCDAEINSQLERNALYNATFKPHNFGQREPHLSQHPPVSVYG